MTTRGKAGFREAVFFESADIADAQGSALCDGRVQPIEFLVILKNALDKTPRGHIRITPLGAGETAGRHWAIR
jgi:hypothetical protein